MTTDLANAVAVVTAAAAGIGRATAVRLAARGATVVAVDIDEPGLAETAARACGPGTVLPTPCDVTAAAAVAALAGRLPEPPAVLVNIVGGARLSPVAELDEPGWDEQLRFNLTSTYLMCHALVPAMAAAGAGTVVNTSSGWGFMPAPQRAAYAASKAGVVAFSRALAIEVAQAGVRVNVVAPGPIGTERMLALTRDDPVAEEKHRAIPLGRLGRPEEVAAVISFLASDEASFICGQVVHVNGGVYMP